MAPADCPIFVDGIELVRKVLELDPALAVVILTGALTPQVVYASSSPFSNSTPPSTSSGSNHSRGADELVHRALKEFGSQTLPFKRFAANAAFYYTMAVAFFFYECFTEDVTECVVPLTYYPTKLRRKVIDFAAKIVRTGGRRVLKVTRTTWDELQIPRLWELSRAPPRFAWA